MLNTSVFGSRGQKNDWARIGTGYPKKDKDYKRQNESSHGQEKKAKQITGEDPLSSILEIKYF